MAARKTNNKKSSASKRNSSSRGGAAWRSSASARKAQSPADKEAARRAPKRGAAPVVEEPADHLLDERTRRDIGGVAMAVAAIALFIMVYMPGNGVVAQAVSAGMHLLLGFGAYLLPFVLVLVGATLVVRFDKEHMPARTAVGLLVLLVAVIGLLGTFTPGVTAHNLNALFLEEHLVAQGGYLGAGIAWVGLSLFGQVVTVIILLGLIVIALLIIGFSLSGLVERARRAQQHHRENRTLERMAREQEGQPDAEGEEDPDADPFADVPVAGQATRRFTDADSVVHQPTRMLHRRPGGSHSFSFFGKGGKDAKGRKTADADEAIAFNPTDFEDDDTDAVTRVLNPDTQRGSAAGVGFGSQRTQRFDAAATAPTITFADAKDAPVAAGTVASGAAAGRKAGDGMLTRKLGAKKRVATTLSERAAAEQASTADAAGSADTDLDGTGAVQKPEPKAATPAKPQPRNRSGKAAAPAKTAPKATAASARSNRSSASRTRANTGDNPLGMPSPTENFVLPPKSILKHSSGKAKSAESAATLRKTAKLLQDTLHDFGVDCEVVDWVAGPTVTLFQVALPSGVRVNRVINLAPDIELALASPGVRIFSPVPGTNHVGVEVPNRVRQTVLLGDVLPAAGPGPLQMALGRDVEGHDVTFDLAKMPHLLIGGTTGSGKSVAINCMIMSILMRATPAEVRMILIDPKRVEFLPYNGIPHLYVPVVTEPKEAASALSWGVAEMERRLKVMSAAGVRNIKAYNAKVHEGLLDTDDQTAEQIPYIVIVIDELADLMMNVGKDVEYSISRIAQLARAAGIHLIVATQRPSTKVVTGLIKANITNRIALNVASGIDSRVILDTQGAEKLLNHGDLLFSTPEYPKPQRLQACFVSDGEIEQVVEHLKTQGEPEYHNEILKTNLMSQGTEVHGSNGSAANLDPLLWDAADIVVGSKLGSTSNLQRRLKVGYSRAGRIMDMLEEQGIVGPANGSKPREVLVDELELESLKAFAQADEAAGR